MSKKTEPQSQEMFVSRVIVENFPSRVELYQKLDKFISDNNYLKDYTADNKDNIVQFIFKNPDIAFEFVKYLNFEKIKNPIYAKLKTNILVDAKKDTKAKSSSSPPKINKKINSKDISSSSEPNTSNIKSPTNKLKPKLAVDLDQSRKKNINISVENHDHGVYDYSTLLPRGKGLFSSTPYGNESHRRYEEYLKNKEKWLIKKGFDSNFGRLDMEKKSVIPNYVFVSPPKIPLQKYQFREINKDKWVNKKEFLYKNSHDLVI